MSFKLKSLSLALLAIQLLAGPQSIHAQTSSTRGAGNAESEPEAWAIHGQASTVIQEHNHFNSPYSGTNSLTADGRTEETTDITLFAGFRPWHSGEIWANIEIDQGFGLNNTLGVAGFPSGEAYKIGANTPYLRLPRLFARHTFNLDGEQEKVEDATNQLAMSRTSDNLILTVGKFSVVDIFDTNTYAHDPRADFLNWAMIDAGAFDYAADAWGFTLGAALEYSHKEWTLRAGGFQLSEVPNAKMAGIHLHQYMLVGEVEHRQSWNEHPGKIKLLAYVNRADMASYDDAIRSANGGIPDVASVRKFASRPGVVVNLEQEVGQGLGVFARVSSNDGSKEAYEFTEINTSILGGLSLHGNAWQRADDTVGVALAVNHLSAAAQRYFSAGGIGILIGDGRLSYANESILETYYAIRLNPHLTASLDYQHIRNPAYNSDRGPVSVVSARLHMEY